MEEERRKAVRIKKSLTVYYCFDNEYGSKIWDITTVKDISETGVSIQTVKAFQPASLICLRLRIPSRPFDNIEVAGKVVDCSVMVKDTTWLTKIEFDNLDQDTRAVFREYVSWVIKSQNDNEKT
jgi:hypothetical protein